MEDEKAIEIYFQEKIKNADPQKKLKKKKDIKNLDQDDEEGMDEYADELFENEMMKNQREDFDFMEDEQG